MTAKNAPYHHRDLRAALIDAAVDLIVERGVQAFSVAEVSRRLGVSIAAPYRHFTDRDTLVAAVAVRACQILAESVANETDTAVTPSAQLAAASRGYVRGAATNQALFQTLFGAGLDKNHHPEVDEAARPVADAFLGPSMVLCGDDREAHTLAVGVVAAAHGHAALLLDGAFGSGLPALETALTLTTGVVSAIIEGRRALSG